MAKTDPCADEKPHAPDPVQVSQALSTFMVWAADHADQEERAALSALLEQGCTHDRMHLVRRLCGRYSQALCRRLASCVS